MMTLLTRDQIRQADDQVVEDVDVPEWGGRVRVRGLTGTQRDKFEGDAVTQRGRKTKLNFRNLRAKLVVLTVIDDAGSLMFNGADVAWLGEKSAAALDRVFSVAQRLAGMSDEDVEELTKNSPSDPSGDSTFD